MNLQQSIENYCQKHNLFASGDKILVAVSGGADSLCLLRVLKNIAPSHDLQLHVAHLNHNLRGEEAIADADHVAKLCQQWQLPLTNRTEDVAALAKTHKLTIEEAARQARYKFLVYTADSIKATKIALGHNANDQAETVLMNFLRGAGIAGLRGMAPVTPLTTYSFLETNQLDTQTPVIIRPLLNTSRTDIEQFCQNHNIQPRFDSSNLDQNFFRNRIRQQLLPLLKSYNPNIYQTLQTTALRMQADYDVLQNELDRLWPLLIIKKNNQAITLKLTTWHPLPLAMKRAILRRAIETLHGNTHNIHFKHIEQAINLLNKKQASNQLDLPHQLKLTISYKCFIISKQNYKIPLPNLPHINKTDRIYLNFFGVSEASKVTTITQLPNSNWYLEASILAQNNLTESMLTQYEPWQAYFDAAIIGKQAMLRTRQSNDYFYPYGLNGHRQSIKKFMINHKIPAHYRKHLPLLIAENGQICWICGWRTDHTSTVTTKTKKILKLQFKQK